MELDPLNPGKFDKLAEDFTPFFALFFSQNCGLAKHRDLKELNNSVLLTKKQYRILWVPEAKWQNDKQRNWK